MSLSLRWPLWGLLVSLLLHLGTGDNNLACCYSNNTCVGAAERWREGKLWREAQQSDRPACWHNWTKTQSAHSFLLPPVIWALPNFQLHTQVNSYGHTTTTITHREREVEFPYWLAHLIITSAQADTHTVHVFQWCSFLAAQSCWLQQPPQNNKQLAVIKH